MDESPSVGDVVSAVGNILRSISDAGFELRRAEPPVTDIQSTDCFDELVSNGLIRQSSGSLFRDGHYARAVEEAFKCLNSAVKEKSGDDDRDGADLMRATFSANSPVLRLNSLQSSSDRNEQRGYMDVFAGVMTGIRNPRAHEPGLVDEPEVALEMLIIANHLMRKLEDSTPAGSDNNE